MGEIYMVAVDPDFQGHGIGRALIEFALDWMKDAGISVAMVETGGDPGHASTRRTYEKADFELFPVARYFRKRCICNDGYETRERIGLNASLSS